MKIVFVIQKLVGLRGGAERVLCDTARALAMRGHEVSIVTYEARSGAAAYDLGGVPVRNLFPFARSGRGARPKAVAVGHRPHRAERLIRAIPNAFPLAEVKWHLTHGAFRRRLAAHLRRDGPDAVVAFLRPAITAAAFAAKGTGIRVIASTHNVPARDYGDAARWDRNPIYAARSLDAFGHCDVITVLLDEFRDWFPEELRSRVHVVPNAVTRLSPPVAAHQARDPVILGVGRLAPVKRFDLLLRAWARICRDHPDWRVEIYGDGEERSVLQALIDASGIAGQARLCGATVEMGPVYDRVSLLCHPARFEGFGLAVAEAFVHGLPALGFSDCPGVNTLIRDGVNGRLIEPGDDPETALAAALAAEISDRAGRNMRGRAAPATMDAYRPEAIMTLWERVLAGGAGPR